MTMRNRRDWLRMYVRAGSARSSAADLKELAQSHFDKVRLRVAENPRTPPEVLEKLSVDHNLDVRVAVATNPSTPDWLVKRLASDEDIVVRHGLAQDINTARELLEQLARDDNAWVSAEAKKTLHILSSWTAQELADERQAIRDRKRGFQRRLERRVKGQKLKGRFVCKTPLPPDWKTRTKVPLSKLVRSISSQQFKRSA